MISTIDILADGYHKMSRFINADRATPCLLPCRHKTGYRKDTWPGVCGEDSGATGFNGNDTAISRLQICGTVLGYLLGMLIFGYAMGVYSNRKIEQTSYDSTTFRSLTANTNPDHDTLATFRRRFCHKWRSCLCRQLRTRRSW
jgi:hypothetical protein